jgi:hypothetical protein
MFLAPLHPLPRALLVQRCPRQTEIGIPCPPWFYLNMLLYGCQGLARQKSATVCAVVELGYTEIHSLVRYRLWRV